jgi:hypothetical protein
VALITDYTTLDALRDYRRVRADDDTVDDVVMQLAITAASRAIDGHCGRHFGQEPAAVARLYSWVGTYLDLPTPDYRTGYVLNTPANWAGNLATLEIDDLGVTDNLVVKTDNDGDGIYEQTLTLGTDYRLWPLNAPADGEPYLRLVLAQGGLFPWSVSGVQITAKWGWTAIPDDVAQACLLQANRLCGRRDSWSGVAGSPELGNELRLLSRLDPDLGPLLSARRRLWVAG